MTVYKVTATRVRRVKEPTLIFDSDLVTRNIGFTSPWPVRLRFFWLSLRAEARPVTMRSDAGIVAKGWLWNDVGYVTRIRLRWVWR